MPVNGPSRPQHKTPGNLNEPREVPHHRPQPTAHRAPPAAAQPAGGQDGMDPPPSTATNGKERADEATALANQQAQEQHEYTMAMMRIQHQQSIQKIVIEAAASISKNASDISEFVTNKI
jgi:hypothetical protein